jgi:hypothetical protein
VENLDEAVDKTEHIKLELFMNPSNPASKYSRHFMIFKDGGAEDWIKCLIEYREVENLMSIREPGNKSKMLWTVLKGQALSYFEHHLRKIRNCLTMICWSW